jgi:hypothetical protein
MFSACHAALMGTLGCQFGLSKSRLPTLAVPIMGLAHSRTVNLTHLAGHLPGKASHASAYRRRQRFFQFVRLVLENGQACSLKTLVRKKRAKSVALTSRGRLNGDAGATAQPVHIAAKRLANDQALIVATNRQEAKQALNLYRRQWGIECLFANAKTRGLNLEDTRLRHPDKLNTLLILVTLAMTWAYRCATRLMTMKAIARKTHGRREKSWFRTGLDALRKWIVDPDKAFYAGTQKAPKQPLKAS